MANGQAAGLAADQSQAAGSGQHMLQNCYTEWTPDGVVVQMDPKTSQDPIHCRLVVCAARPGGYAVDLERLGGSRTVGAGWTVDAYPVIPSNTRLDQLHNRLWQAFGRQVAADWHLVRVSIDGLSLHDVASRPLGRATIRQFLQGAGRVRIPSGSEHDAPTLRIWHPCRVCGAVEMHLQKCCWTGPVQIDQRYRKDSSSSSEEIASA